MAEKHLDVPQVGAAAEQMRRAGVPERVWREPDAEATPVILDARTVSPIEPTRTRSP